MTESEQRYLEVLMEEMNGKFTLVLEGHDAIRKEFNEQLDEIREQQKLFMSLLQTSHGSLKEEIQGVRTELKEEIQGVRAELKEEIRAVDRRLTSEIRSVGDKVDGHEDRIRLLERKAA